MSNTAVSWFSFYCGKQTAEEFVTTFLPQVCYIGTHLTFQCKTLKLNDTSFSPQSLSFISIPNLTRIELDDSTANPLWSQQMTCVLRYTQLILYSSRSQFVLQHLFEQMSKSLRPHISVISCFGVPYGPPDATWKGGDLSKYWPGLRARMK